MSTFGDIQDLRRRFLRAAYELSGGQLGQILGLETIAEKMEMDLNDSSNVDKVANIAKYLTERGYVRRQYAGYGAVSITAAGIDEVESWEQGTSNRIDEIESNEPQYLPSGMSATPDEFSNTAAVGEPPVEIRESLRRFEKDNPDSDKVAFIMMQFGRTSAHEQIAFAIKNSLANHNITGIRADDKRYHDDLFYNVLTYIHGSGLGIAVFERLEADATNPNVALEVGYLFALRKPVCLLKDQTLGTLQADLVGRLYDPFDPQDPTGTIPLTVSKWLSDKGLV